MSSSETTSISGDILNRMRSLEIASRQNGDSVFSAESVERLFSCPWVPVPPQNYVFVSIKPASGTDDFKKGASDFVCVAVGEGNVILRIMAVPVIRHSDFEGELEVFLQEVRKVPFTDTILVVDIEGNASMEWAYIYSFVQQKFNNVLFLRDFHRKTDARLKEMSAKYTRSLLESGELKIWEGFHTQDIGEFRRQMLDYQALESLTRAQNGESCVVYRGKDGKDDISFTLQRALFRQFEFYSAGC